MKKAEKIFTVIVAIIMILETIFAMVDFCQGNIQTATYDLLWAVALSIPFYHEISEVDE